MMILMLTLQGNNHYHFESMEPVHISVAIAEWLATVANIHQNEDGNDTTVNSMEYMSQNRIFDIDGLK